MSGLRTGNDPDEMPRWDSKQRIPRGKLSHLIGQAELAWARPMKCPDEIIVMFV